MNKSKLKKVLALADALCRERGVRLTQQRRKVLELVCASDRPLGAYEILDRLRETLDNPAPPTAYRALEFLLEQGLVHKLETLHAYVGCSHPDHPHASQFLICTACGDVTEIADEAVSDSLGQAAAATGFRPSHRVVEVTGTCAECAGDGERS